MKDYVNSAALQEYTTKLVAKLKTLFPGTPTAAATVADMTDHSKTYVYVGSETGYTAGDWYYWDGTAWTSGGPFQATSIITDTTLAVAGEAADAKATGDAIAAAKTAVLNAMAPAYSTSATYAVGDYVNYNGSIYRCTTAITTAESWTSGHWTAVVLGADLAAQVSDLKTQIEEDEAITIETEETEVTTEILGSLTWTSGYMGITGSTGATSNMQYSNKIHVVEGDILNLSPSAAECRFVCAFNGDSAVDLSGEQNVNTYTVPEGIDGIVITVYIPGSNYAPSSITLTTKEYTKKNILEDRVSDIENDISSIEDEIDTIDEAITVKQYQDETDTDITPTFTDGFMNTSGTVNDTGSSAYFDHTQKITVQEGDTVGAYKNGNAYDMRFVCAFSGDTPVSIKGWDNSGSTVGPYTVPEGIDGVIISVRDSYRVNKIVVTHKETAQSAYVKPAPMGYMMEQDTLADGDSMYLPYHNVKNENVYIFNANINTFTKIKFSKENSFYIEVDSTNLYITNDANTLTIPHNISIADNITLIICNTTAANVSLIRVSSDGQEFDYTTATRFLMDDGTPQIQSVGSALSECTFSWISKNVNAPIWLFGDSYFSWYNNRWTYYLARDGYTKDCLLNGYAGEASANAYNALINLLAITTPKIVVWCMGMNDGDSTTAVNANWLKYYNRLVNLAKKYGFEIVLYTVPTTPVINNNFKNAIIRESGYRYIEADLAVRIDENGNWIPGALNEGTTENPDNVHPTVMGAKIIYHRVIADLPEIMCNY